MFRKNLILVWILVLVLSGMFLMGQETWPPPVTSPAPLPKTGQTVSYATGDDGDLQMGVVWPSPRFTDNANGTVTDNLTGLIWTKDAGCDDNVLWHIALETCNVLQAGMCGLSDGSSAGDWRLPNVRELLSLIDYGNHDPAFPTGHPFTNVELYDLYWSSTTYAGAAEGAWCVGFGGGGGMTAGLKYIFDLSVWCVRGGQ